MVNNSNIALTNNSLMLKLMFQSNLLKTIRLSVFLVFSLFLALSLNAQQTDSFSFKSDSSEYQELLGLEILPESISYTNLNSPRSTIQNFLSNINSAHHMLIESHKKNLKIPGLFIAEELKQSNKQIELFFSKAKYCLDLSEFPPSLQKDLGYGRSIMFKEILDRIDLPPLEEIPDETEVDYDFENHKYPKLEYWQIPNSELIFVRMQRGVHKGQYVLSSETVEKLPIIYNQIRHLPYKTNKDVSEGFYDFYISTPGTLMPPRWSVFLPEWSNKILYSQTIWQWLAVLVVVVLSTIIIFLLYKLLIKIWEQHSSYRRDWSRVLFFGLVILIFVFLNNVINEEINITGITLLVIKISLESFIWMLISFFSYNFLIAISETIIKEPRVASIGLEATFTRATFMVLATFVAIIIIIIGLSQIGVSIVPLLTGVGIGGLAIALAARNTLENIIGSFTIFADKPYRVNERVKVMGYNGTIESIGIRSTQIRLLTGPLVSIPNEKMATVEIENIHERPFLRQEFNLRIKYESSPEMVENSIQIIKDVLSVPEGFDGTHPNQAINAGIYPPRVHFNKINDDSLNIYVSYWFFPADWWEFMKFSESINLEIIKRLNAASIDFAFPTQMLHLNDNGGVPDDANK